VSFLSSNPTFGIDEIDTQGLGGDGPSLFGVVIMKVTPCPTTSFGRVVTPVNPVTPSSASTGQQQREQEQEQVQDREQEQEQEQETDQGKGQDKEYEHEQEQEQCQGHEDKEQRQD